MIKYLGIQKPVRLWCLDESRFGLITISGKIITLSGVKPEGKRQWKRGNYYVYGIVEPATGEGFFQKYPGLNSEYFQQFIRAFSQQYSESLNLIIMDNASSHKALALVWPENIIPIYQPAHSPELNPIERLWEDIKQKLHWENFTNLEELQKYVDGIIQALTSQTISSICGWDYITSALLSATSS